MRHKKIYRNQNSENEYHLECNVEYGMLSHIRAEYKNPEGDIIKDKKYNCCTFWLGDSDTKNDEVEFYISDINVNPYNLELARLMIIYGLSLAEDYHGASLFNISLSLYQSMGEIFEDDLPEQFIDPTTTGFFYEDITAVKHLLSQRVQSSGWMDASYEKYYTNTLDNRQYYLHYIVGRDILDTISGIYIDSTGDVIEDSTHNLCRCSIGNVHFEAEEVVFHTGDIEVFPKIVGLGSLMIMFGLTIAKNTCGASRFYVTSDANPAWATIFSEQTTVNLPIPSTGRYANLDRMIDRLANSARNKGWLVE